MLFVLLGLSVVSGWGMLALLGRLDRPSERRKTSVLGLTFVAAGALSVLPSFALYGLSPLWFADTTAGTWGRILFIWLVNAPVEELAKYATFALTATLLKSIREPQDGSLQGAQTGLGFALVENFLYGLSGGWELLVLRAFVSLPGHMIYGAVWGGYHGFEVYQGGGRVRRWSTPALALVPAIFSHALFNTLATLGVGLVWNILADTAMLGFGLFLYSRLVASSPVRQRRSWREWKLAIPELEHALSLQPRSVLLRQRLAGYYLAGAQPGRALEHLDVAQELSPGDPWTEFYREAAQRQQGGRTGPLPPIAELNPALFRALSGRT